MRAACTEFDRKSMMLAFVKAVEAVSEPLVRHDLSYLGPTNQKGIDFITDVLRGNRNKTAHQVSANPAAAVLMSFETAQTTFLEHMPTFFDYYVPTFRKHLRDQVNKHTKDPSFTTQAISATGTELETASIYSFGSVRSLQKVRSTLSKAAKGHLIPKLSLRMPLFQRYTHVHSIRQRQCPGHHPVHL